MFMIVILIVIMIMKSIFYYRLYNDDSDKNCFKDNVKIMIDIP